MITTKQKELTQILDSLKGYQAVFLVGCGECSTTCKTGGEEQVKKLKNLLEGQGKNVVGTCIPKAPCVSAQLKQEFAKNSKALRQAEAIVVLSCGLGVQSVKANDRLGLAVLPACDSLFGAVMDAQGNFLEKCSLCGECVLAQTAGICPITLCAKGLLNGPCGGMNKGKCEVDQDKDCAWVLIYQELDKKKDAGRIKKVHPPRDFQKTVRPRRIAAPG